LRAFSAAESAAVSSTTASSTAASSFSASDEDALGHEGAEADDRSGDVDGRGAVG
jgi:hypothetical protein